jgi:hypothetical protein
VILDSEVTRIEPVHLGGGEIREIGVAAFTREEHVVLSPEDDRFGLPLAQERLPLG